MVRRLFTLGYGKVYQIDIQLCFTDIFIIKPLVFVSLGHNQNILIECIIKHFIEKLSLAYTATVFLTSKRIGGIEGKT